MKNRNQFILIALVILVLSAGLLCFKNRIPFTFGNMFQKNSEQRCMYAITGRYWSLDLLKSQDEFCLKYFDKAMLEGSENKILVNRFQFLHESWFRNQSPRYFNESELLPNLEASYNVQKIGAYLTKALFDEDYPFNKIFKDDQEYTLKENTTNKNERDWIDFVELKTHTPPNNAQSYKEFPYHRDAGILSSTSYLFLNLDGELDFIANGTWYSHRLFSKSIFSDFLCMSHLPQVENKDVESFVDKKHFLPFMKSNNCIKCHASMEPLAEGVRNFHFKKSELSGKPGIVLESLSKNKKDNRSWPYLPQRQHSEMVPEGQVFVRDSQGKLIDVRFVGLRGLAEFLSKEPDVYRCLVRRYFEYFESAGGRGDYEAEIEKLSKNLLREQSLRNTMRSIIEFSFKN